MLNLYTRKQFFKQTIGQSLKALNQLFDLNLFSSSKTENNISSKFNAIASDFSPSFLKTETQNLGLDINSLKHEDALKAIHEAMEKQRQSTEDHKNVL
ncbi:MAG: hypothetical protein Q7J15_05055 [Candidatus Desulfaltia sp.]|nr:hypothetical protein [Candidatus Desulfaltia sp.]